MLTQSDEGMAEGFTKKKPIRAGHKSSVTRILGQLDDLWGAANPTSAVNMAKLTQAKPSRETRYTKRVDEEIIEHLEEDKFEDEIEQADSFEEEIFMAMVKIDQLSMTAPTPPPPPLLPPLKLLKLTLRAFNGDITIWTTFWDSYESAVHKNSELWYR